MEEEVGPVSWADMVEDELDEDLVPPPLQWSKTYEASLDSDLAAEEAEWDAECGAEQGAFADTEEAPCYAADTRSFNPPAPPPPTIYDDRPEPTEMYARRVNIHRRSGLLIDIVRFEPEYVSTVNDDGREHAPFPSLHRPLAPRSRLCVVETIEQSEAAASPPLVVDTASNSGVDRPLDDEESALLTSTPETENAVQSGTPGEEPVSESMPVVRSPVLPAADPPILSLWQTVYTDSHMPILEDADPAVASNSDSRSNSAEDSTSPATTPEAQSPVVAATPDHACSEAVYTGTAVIGVSGDRSSVRDAFEWEDADDSSPRSNFSDTLLGKKTVALGQATMLFMMWRSWGEVVAPFWW